MSNFTKTLTASALALAVSGLTTGTAFAETDITSTYMGSSTTVQLDVKGCGKEKEKNLDAELVVMEDGFQQGEWALTLFQFAGLVMASGPFIESKPGKELVGSLDDESLAAILAFINNIVTNECFGDYDDASTELKKYTITFNKKGDNAKFKLQMNGKYETDNSKTKNVKLSINGDADLTGTEPTGTDMP
ncbi:MAG: hypothetical protein U9P11_01650 [Pseudomonadota bacterium]|nr:hypothetical protein [Pseudomonadota bacterium]